MVFFVAFLFWVLVANIVFHPFYCFLFLFGVTGICLCAYLWFKKDHFFIFFWYMGVFFGVLFSLWNGHQVNKKLEYLDKYFGQNYTFQMEIDDIYKSKWENTTYIGHPLETPNIKFIFQVKSSQKYNQNDRVELRGQLSKIPVVSETFLYDRFLFSKWVYAQILYPNILSYQYGHQNVVLKKIQWLRQSIIEKALDLFPKNEAALALGILIGNTEYFDEDIWELYSRAGLSHLVAVSGYNITLVMLFVGAFIFFLPRRPRFIIMGGSIFFFVLLVGASLSVVRAAIMWVLWYWVMTMWRSSNAYGIFVFTAFILVLYEPLLLPYDLSFLLSFLAVLGILTTQHFWGRLFFWVPKFFALRESLVLTLSALTTTFPILCFQFWKIAYFSVISNILVWGVMPFAMFFSAGALVFWYIFDVWAYWIWYVAYFLLHFVVRVAQFFWGFSWWVQEFFLTKEAFYWEGIYFIIFFFCIFYFYEQKKENI